MGKKYRFDRDFCYNLDMNLGKIIAKALKAYRENVVGVPNDLIYEAVGDGDVRKVRTVDEASKIWRKLLKEMEWSFREIGKGRPHEPHYSKCKSPEDFRREAGAYNRKVQRGLNLFAEYYQALWI